ncbi:hypothetical protein PoB_000717800 [Plakobranchus ocellatus]|uniref:Uncharacterized protein n=1 Tax=Plakobranchus ocellatus TaxID=259542 RepID=A0AAV3YDW3_9GAST|nr:hypothetical protein PoB_000717800 [Plakobranchus ocellatus]
MITSVTVANLAEQEKTNFLLDVSVKTRKIKQELKKESADQESEVTVIPTKTRAKDFMVAKMRKMFQGVLRPSSALTGQGADGGARTRDRMVLADPRTDIYTKAVEEKVVKVTANNLGVDTYDLPWDPSMTLYLQKRRAQEEETKEEGDATDSSKIQPDPEQEDHSKGPLGVLATEPN